MPEMVAQVVILDRPWKMPGIRERAEDALRYELGRAGCHDITIEEPRHELNYPDPNGEVQYAPYWAWEISAFGYRG